MGNAMPTLLADPPQAIYLLLGAGLIVLALVWLKRRDRRVRNAFLAVAILTVLLGLCDYLFQSPRESAVQVVKDISAAINAGNWDAIDVLVSNDFDYHGHKKSELKTQLRSAITSRDARTAVWEFNRDKVMQKGENEVTIVFDGKGDPKVGAAYYAHFKATVFKESDGRWRLRTLALYPYASKTNGPEETFPIFPQQ